MLEHPGGAVKHTLEAEADCRLKYFLTCQHMRVSEAAAKAAEKEL